jgi:hypothetical protein
VILGPLLAAALLSVPQSVRQDATARRFYAYGSTVFSYHPDNGATYHRVEDRLGGHTWTIAAGAGGFITPSIGLEGEFVFGGIVSAPQRFSYAFSTDYIAQNRDILFNELLRYRPGGRSAFQIVAGGGLARTTARMVDVVFTDSTGKKINVPDSPPATYNGLTFTGGVDVAAAVSPHVALAPTVRVRWQHRPSSDGYGWNGIGNMSFQFGASVFFR